MSRRRRRGGPPPPRRRPKPVPARASGAPADVAKALLDGAAVTAMISALSRDGWEVRSHKRRSVQRRGSEVSIVFGVTMRREGADRSATVVVHWTSRAVPPGARIVLVQGLRLHVWRYPSDPFMPGLLHVTSKKRLRAFLDELEVVPGEVDELVRRVYRPTRRGVVEARLTAPDGSPRTVYCKSLGDRDHKRLRSRTAELVATHRVLATRLPVPEVLAVVEGEGVVVFDEVPGKTLRLSILDGDPTPTPMEVAGLALSMAELHVDTDADPRRYADPTRHATVIGGVLPSEAARVKALVERCRDLDGPLVTVHGDFHDGQVLVADGAISGLLDVDGVGKGLLAHDAGRMIAYIESIADIPRADEPTVMAYSKGLQDAFADHVDRETLGRAAASAFVALATGPHRRQQKDWEASTVRRLDHAQRWLEDVGAW